MIMMYILAGFFVVVVSLCIVAIVYFLCEELILAIKAIRKYKGLKWRWLNYDNYEYSIGWRSGTRFYRYFKDYEHDGKLIHVTKEDGEKMWYLMKFIKGVLWLLFIICFLTGCICFFDLI